MIESPVKILIVDDEEDLREVLSESLEDEGYKVASAEDAQEAITKVEENGFTIMFMDIVLPDINGVQAYKVIKKIDPRIVTIMMTGHAVKNLVKEAMDEGAYDCLYKPFGIDEILNVVKKITE